MNGYAEGENEVITWPDGRKYVRQLKKGLPDGRGTLIWSDGTWLELLFEEGQVAESDPSSQSIIMITSNTSYNAHVHDFVKNPLKGILERIIQNNYQVITPDVEESLKTFLNELQKSLQKQNPSLI